LRFAIVYQSSRLKLRFNWKFEVEDLIGSFSLNIEVEKDWRLKFDFIVKV